MTKYSYKIVNFIQYMKGWKLSVTKNINLINLEFRYFHGWNYILLYINLLDIILFLKFV